MIQQILVVSRTFYPKEGGIEEYVYNRCLQDPENIIVLSASVSGDQSFDEGQSFPVYRWNVPQWMYKNAFTTILRQILYLASSIIYALKIYQKHSYQSLEWAHGYDFPALLALTYFLPVHITIYLHGNDLLCPLKNPLFKQVFQWTLNRVQHIVCNSSYTRDCLINQFRCDQNVTIINPSIRPEKFGPIALDAQGELRKTTRQLYQIPDDAIVLLSVGRLVKRKGFDRVIAHLPHLIKNNINVHYLIGGRGAMEAELRSQAIALGVADRVHFVGFVPDRELANYYSASDLFVLLTFFSEAEASIEGFGIVYLEAAYFGKPILATRVGGVVDAVQHNINGILTDPFAPIEEIDKILLQLCQDHELREKMGQKGREMTRNNVSHRTNYK